MWRGGGRGRQYEGIVIVGGFLVCHSLTSVEPGFLPHMSCFPYDVPGTSFLGYLQSLGFSFHPSQHLGFYKYKMFVQDILPN